MPTNADTLGGWHAFQRALAIETVAVRDGFRILVLCCSARIVLPFAGLLALALPAVAAQPSWRERFETEAPVGWRRLETSALPIAGSFTDTSDTVMTDRTGPDFGKHIIPRAEFKFWLTDGAVKMVADRWNGPGQTWRQCKASAVNPSYAFVAQQEVRGGPYSIIECGHDQDTRQRVEFGIRIWVSSWVQSSYKIESDIRPLAEIVKSSGFRLVTCDGQTREGRQLVQAQIEFTPWELAAQQGSGTTRAKILLDPEFDWRVVKNESECDNKTRGHLSSDMEITYSSDPEHPADIKRMVWHLKDKSSSLTDTLEFSAVSHDPVSRDEFYLPALGLPDCSGAGDQGARGGWRLRPIGITLIVAAVVFALICRRQMRRRSA